MRRFLFARADRIGYDAAVAYRQTQITEPQTHRRTLRFAGRVQGVGFRYTTRNLCLSYDVRGYVRNLPDGRVELVMEGPDDEIEHVVQDLCRKMEGFIRHLDSDVSPPTGEFEHFSIKH